MLEWCCNPGSLIARYSRRIPHTKAVRLGLHNIDLADAVQVAKLRRMGSKYLESNGALRVFVSIPCTCWCKLQSLNVHQYGKAFVDRLQRERQGSQHMMRLFLSTYRQWKRESPTKVSGAFEWPQNLGWNRCVNIARSWTSFCAHGFQWQEIMMCIGEARISHLKNMNTTIKNTLAPSGTPLTIKTADSLLCIATKETQILENERFQNRVLKR